MELVADNQDAAELKNCEVRLVDNIHDVLGNAMFTEGTLLGSWAGPASNGETITINPPGRNHFAAGRFVLIQCRTDGTKLKLAEVRVFGGGVSNFCLFSKRNIKFQPLPLVIGRAMVSCPHTYVFHQKTSQHRI